MKLRALVNLGPRTEPRISRDCASLGELLELAVQSLLHDALGVVLVDATGPGPARCVGVASRESQGAVGARKLTFTLYNGAVEIDGADRALIAAIVGERAGAQLTKNQPGSEPIHDPPVIG